MWLIFDVNFHSGSPDSRSWFFSRSPLTRRHLANSFEQFNCLWSCGLKPRPPKKHQNPVEFWPAGRIPQVEDCNKLQLSSTAWAAELTCLGWVVQQKVVDHHQSSLVARVSRNGRESKDQPAEENLMFSLYSILQKHGYSTSSWVIMSLFLFFRIWLIKAGFISTMNRGKVFHPIFQADPESPLAKSGANWAHQRNRSSGVVLWFGIGGRGPDNFCRVNQPRATWDKFQISNWPQKSGTPTAFRCWV